jgi:hypothetical protein
LFLNSLEKSEFNYPISKTEIIINISLKFLGRGSQFEIMITKKTGNMQFIIWFMITWLRLRLKGYPLNQSGIQSGKIYTSGGISAGIALSFHVLDILHGKTITKSTAEV